MAWEKISETQIKGKCRGEIRNTPEWAEIMHIVTNGGLQRGQALRLKKMPNIPNKHVATTFTVNLNKEFKRQNLPYRASAYGQSEVNVRRTM